MFVSDMTATTLVHTLSVACLGDQEPRINPCREIVESKGVHSLNPLDRS